MLRTILLLFALNFLLGAEAFSEVIFTFRGGTSPVQIKSSAVTTLPLNQWQIAGSKKNIKAPFFIRNKENIELSSVFSLPAISDSQEVFLADGGFPGSAEIFLNGSHIGFQANDFAPAELRLPVTLLKRQQKNSIVLKLFRPQTTKKGFPKFVRLFSETPFTGITRPVFLEIRNKNHITNFKTQINFKNNLPVVDFEYEIQLFSALKQNKRVTVDEKITGPGSKLLYKKKYYFEAEKQKIKREFQLGRNFLWSPERPRQLNFSFIIERGKEIVVSKTIRSGIRQISLKNNKIFLNQKPLLIRGINYHLDPTRLTSGNYADLVKTNFRWLKENGFNAIRLPHYVPDAIMLNTADSLGLLLFAELPIWRYPAEMFSNDNLLELAKSSLKRIALLRGLHPSLAAVGIGQELPLQNSATQKFMFILNDYLHLKLNTLSFISPIPGKSLPLEKTADLYILDTYHSLQIERNNPFSVNKNFNLAGQLGINQPENGAEIQKENNLAREIRIALGHLHFSGGFIESFQDWHTAFPTEKMINDKTTEHIIRSGFFSVKGQSKADWQNLADLWESSSENYIYEQVHPKNNNIFSIIIFLAFLFFYAIYRKQIRMRENFQRSLHHPYGFFVDIRERRIIPLFNSFMIGAFAALILAIFFASTLYYYRDNYALQEIMNIFLGPLHWYKIYLQLAASPFLLSLLLFVLLLCYPFALSVLLKFIGIFNEKKIRYRQALAISLWSGLPLIIFFPLSLINYYLLIHYSIQNYLFIILILFIIWAHYRILNGIRVLLVTKMRKVFSLLLLSYIIPFIILWIVLKPAPYMMDYLNLLLHPGNLF